jgi:hypothetical protein
MSDLDDGAARQDESLETAMAECIAALALLADPAALTRARPTLARDQPQRAIDAQLARLLEALEGQDEAATLPEPLASHAHGLLVRVRAAVRDWTFEADAPGPLVDLARAAVAALRAVALPRGSDGESQGFGGDDWDEA